MHWWMVSRIGRHLEQDTQKQKQPFLRVYLQLLLCHTGFDGRNSTIFSERQQSVDCVNDRLRTIVGEISARCCAKESFKRHRSSPCFTNLEFDARHRYASSEK